MLLDEDFDLGKDRGRNGQEPYKPRQLLVVRGHEFRAMGSKAVAMPPPGYLNKEILKEYNYGNALASQLVKKSFVLRNELGHNN